MPGAPPPPDQPLSTDEALKEIARRQGGNVIPRGNDPGFAKLENPELGQQGKTSLVYRDLPVISLTTTWMPASIRNALNVMITGNFEYPGQLIDSIIADDRVTATLNSRMAGLFGRDVRFEGAGGKAKGSRAAKEALDAWQDNWEHFTSDGSLYQIAAYQNLMGFWPSQLIWDTTKPLWGLRPEPWHARYTYYNWDVRKYIALSQDGPIAVIPGDGKWMLHAPRGPYRAWMWGTMRAIALPWLLRQYALRDMANFSEVYGAPTRVGWTPAAADPVDRAAFQQQLSNLGANTTLMLARGVDKDMGYGYELVSVGQADWTIFPGLADRCDLHITLAILMQNLTTEVKGGSFAATESHMDIRQAGIEADNQAWKATLRKQAARPFAYFNFGDSDLAPSTDWDVTSRDEQTARATRFYSFAQASQIMRQGGITLGEPGESTAPMREFALNEFGVRLPDQIKFAEPDNGAGTGAADAETEASTKTIKGGK